MKNLPPKFKKVFDEIKPLFNISVYEMGNMSYSSCHKLYNKINNILDKYNCHFYDLNNILKKYPKRNQEHSVFVNKLRKFVIIKNKGYARRIYKSDKWESFIKDTKKNTNRYFLNTINSKHIKDGIINIMKKDIYNWEGYWSLAPLKQNGELKNIDFINVGDYDNLLLYLAKKNNWQIKNKDIKNKLRNM